MRTTDGAVRRLKDYPRRLITRYIVDMSENEGPSVITDAPVCPKCGAVTFGTTRTMRVHDHGGGSPVTRDNKVPVWRCMRCSNEVAREV